MEISEEEKFGVFIQRFLNNDIEQKELYNLSKQLFTNKNIDIKDEEIDKQYEWDEIFLNIGHSDDFYKMHKNTDINEVKKKCIELKSNLFVAKSNCQYYIRSPPSVKKNRDYKSIKNKAEEMISNGKVSKWKSYILKPNN